MRFISLFSGIEAASVAWLPLGWECVGVAEIDKFPRAVLAHHYPDVPNLGNIETITEAQILALGHIDLVVGGFPCQDVSVAGKRAGLENEDGTATRSGLFFAAMRVVGWTRARWTVIENVPGLFSSKQGRDFALMVGALAGCEFGVPREGWKNMGAAAGPAGLVEWSVLDAQWAGVPQRRRRVFLVRDSGNWICRPPVLFERHSLQGHPPPSREKRECPTYPVAPCIGASGLGFERTGDPRGQDCVVAGTVSASPPSKRNGGSDPTASHLIVAEIAHATTTHQAKGGDPTTDKYVVHSLRGEGFDASKDGTGRGTPLVPISIQAGALKENPEHGPDGVGVRTDGQAYTLEARAEVQAIAFNHQDNHAFRASSSSTNPLRTNQTEAVAFMPARSFGKDGGIDSRFAERPMCDAIHTGSGGGNKAPLVAAVALRDREGGGTAELSEVPSALRASGGGGDKAHVLSAMQVRRLIPRECELLQGFPSTRERVTLEICSDLLHNIATVALSCLRWQSNASPANAQRYPQSANTAESISLTSQASREPLAVLSVRTSSVDSLHEIHSRGRLIWSASNADELNKFLPHTQAAGIAAALAPHLRDLARAIRTGKAESLQSIRLSTRAQAGARSATRSGNESGASVSDATSAASPERFTTSTLGALVPTCGSPVATLLCSALAVISGCIPSETLPECFLLEFNLETPYTLIPHTRNKLAADGPRYKALGNSMAVPVMRWIGERIQLVDWLTEGIPPA